MFIHKKQLLHKILFFSLLLTFFTIGLAQQGKLNVGFDIDDTVLFSENMFVHYIAEYGRPINYDWINTNDKNYSVPIKPTIDLVHYFWTNGHNVYFITARSDGNGNVLAEYLTDILGYSITKDVNLFFMPKEEIENQRFTTKHRKMNDLNLDLYYGDSDTDIIAALKASVHPVRVVRSSASLKEYSSNYFGNTQNGVEKETPFDAKDLEIFYSKSVGVFGESIYPIVWDEPNE